MDSISLLRIFIAGPWILILVYGNEAIRVIMLIAKINHYLQGMKVFPLFMVGQHDVVRPKSLVSSCFEFIF